jgi:hypothetical protein
MFTGCKSGFTTRKEADMKARKSKIPVSGGLGKSGIIRRLIKEERSAVRKVAYEKARRERGLNNEIR